MNVLDRSIGIAATKVDTTKVDTHVPDAAPSRPERWGVGRLIALVRGLWQFSVRQSFSSLTRRIVFLNVAGLLALSIGITFLLMRRQAA